MPLSASIRPLDEISFADWRRVLSTNLDSAFVFTKGLSPRAQASGRRAYRYLRWCHCVAGSEEPCPCRGFQARNRWPDQSLGAGSSGVWHSRKLRIPGQIETSRAQRREVPDRSSDIPLGRRGTPFEIAGMVRSLCGPAGAYMTGQTLHINGGLSNSGV